MLADTARRKQESVGWRIVTEPATGARLGLPTKLVPQLGQRRQRHQMDLADRHRSRSLLARRKEANPTTAKLAEREKKEPAGRTIDYTVVKPDFFVLSGLQGLKKFYLRGTFKGDEVRILTILYDQATEDTVEPVVIAMSSAFSAFPAGAQTPARRRARPWNMAPASWSATTAPSSPTARSIDGCAAPSRSPGYRQRRSRRRGQGARSGAAAHLRRARPEAARPRRWRRARRHSTSPGSPIRRARAAAAAASSVKASVAQIGGGRRSRAVTGRPRSGSPARRCPTAAACPRERAGGRSPETGGHMPGGRAGESPRTRYPRRSTTHGLDRYPPCLGAA